MQFQAYQGQRPTCCCQQLEPSSSSAHQAQVAELQACCCQGKAFQEEAIGLSLQATPADGIVWYKRLSDLTKLNPEAKSFRLRNRLIGSLKFVLHSNDTVASAQPNRASPSAPDPTPLEKLDLINFKSTPIPSPCWPEPPALPIITPCNDTEVAAIGSMDIA
nr:hypothetical protein Iba_contig165CG0010 [Ipomoea batatas]